MLMGIFDHFVCTSIRALKVSVVAKVSLWALTQFSCATRQRFLSHIRLTKARTDCQLTTYWDQDICCPLTDSPFNHITKTYLYNFDPLKPHFYIVKLGFTGVYIIFLISAQNIDCGYSLEPPRRGGSNEYPQSMFWAEIWKISEIFIWKFSVFGDQIFHVFE